MDDQLIETATRAFFEAAGREVEVEFGSIESLKRATWGQVVRMMYEYGWEIMRPDGSMLIPWEEPETEEEPRDELPVDEGEPE